MGSRQEAGIIVTKKLLIDLWASATSHLVVAEWLPSAPSWFESGMVIILTGVLLVRFFAIQIDGRSANPRLVQAELNYLTTEKSHT